MKKNNSKKKNNVKKINKKNINKKDLNKKEFINKLLPGFILAFVVSFMFFIYEPLLMYSTNIDDFWFDFKLLFNSTLILFLVVFIILIIAYFMLYLIDKKYFKNNKLLNIITIIGYALFFIFYIQGNYLIGGLPPLDGSKIIWGKYIAQHIISVVLILIVAIALYFLTKKFKYEKVINISKYISLSIFGMLSISLITTILTTKDVFSKKDFAYVSTENLETYSSDENLIVFVVDSVDSILFKEILDNNDKYSNTFENFTYYPDTVSAYPFTQNSIPFILSGIWNENKTNFMDYYDKALEDSLLLSELRKEKYKVNVYEHNLVSKDIKKLGFENVVTIEKFNMHKLFNQELKYTLFKYLPFPLKKYSRIEKMDFNYCKEGQLDNMFEWDDKQFYNLLKNDIKKTSDKQFKFIHIEGGHKPYNYDKDLNSIEDGTYEQKLEATLTIINKYLHILKENGVYDNSNIIILADHGHKEDRDNGRQNPILFIKGINEEHEMYESELPISYEDLNDVYLDLLDKKTSEELFDDIDINRERKYILYEYGYENHMEEYVQKGKAWDDDTLEKTGKEFNR